MATTADNGLVGAWRLDGRGGAVRVGWPEVRTWTPEAGTLWVLLERHGPAERWVREESGLDEVVADALLADETRPRVAVVGDGLLLFLRGVNLNPGADPTDMVSLRLWTDGRRLVSTRLRRLRAAEGVADALARGEGPHTVGGFLVALVERLLANMADALEDLHERMDTLEEEVLVNGSRALRTELSELRRRAVILRRYLAPQRDAVQRLQAEPVAWLDADDRLNLRESADALTRHVEDLDAIKDRAAIVQEDLGNRLSERLEGRMYLLAIISAVFLPLTFVSGLLGINVGGIPGAENPWAFTAVSGGLVVVGAALWLLLRRWLWL